MNKGPDTSRTISKIYEQRLAIYGHKTKHVSGKHKFKIYSNLNLISRFAVCSSSSYNCLEFKIKINFISKEPLISKWGFFKLIVLNIKIRSTTTNPLCICCCIRVLLKIFILFYCGIQFARAAILFLPATIHNLEKRVTWKNQTLWLMGLV